jgi:hypothetical protein
VECGLWTVHSRAEPHRKIGVTESGNSLLRFNPETFPALVDLLLKDRKDTWEQVGAWSTSVSWRTVSEVEGWQAAWLWKNREGMEFKEVLRRYNKDPLLVWKPKGLDDKDLNLGLTVLSESESARMNLDAAFGELGIDEDLMRGDLYQEGSGVSLRKRLQGRRKALLDALEDYKKVKKLARAYDRHGGHLGLVKTIGKNIRTLMDDKAPLLASDEGRGDRVAFLAWMAKRWLAGELEANNTQTP